MNFNAKRPELYGRLYTDKGTDRIRSNYMLDWTLGEVLIALAILACVVLVFVSASHRASLQKEFMAECKQHEPNYRCVAMWRAGISHSGARIAAGVATGIMLSPARR